jgi:hypothetical protein
MGTDLLRDNAKEPDVGAEFFLFFKEDLRVHQALSPGAFGKVFFPFPQAMHIDLMVLFRCGCGGA